MKQHQEGNEVALLSSQNPLQTMEVRSDDDDDK
jgi:hypothetical protein